MPHPHSRERLHAALALLPDDPSQADFLLQRALTASAPEILILCNALRPIQPDTESLWPILQDEQQSQEQRFRAACVLANFAPKDQRWEQVRGLIIDTLLAENPLRIASWATALRPARIELLPALERAFRDGNRSVIERDLATNLLSDYAADQPERLVQALVDSEPSQFSRLFQTLMPLQEQAILKLRSILKQPRPAEKELDAREQLARRQANAGVALLRLGEAEDVWGLLRHSEDHACRTYVQLGLGRLGVSAELLIARLEQEQDAAVRRALILSLGEFTEQAIPRPVRERLIPRLLTWYREDPDPGVHSAIDWLLRHDRRGPNPRKLAWGQTGILEKLDCQLRGEPQGRHWYVNCEGHTLAIIRQQPTFLMGSTKDEPEHGPAETPRHQRKIARVFAVGTKEVTVEQYQRFREATGQGDRPHSFNREYSPDSAGAMIGLTWFDAAMYCNWLSAQDGLPEAEWCYPREIREGMQLSADFLKRKGYRLPTEAEWEYVCRTGQPTPRFWGSSSSLLDEYAWWFGNSMDRCWPVGQQLPNDLGMFDIHGNALEWCQNRFASYPILDANKFALDEPSLFDLRVVDSALMLRSLRGGSFGSRPRNLRSAVRLRDRPGTRFDSVGFRVARTLE